MAQGRNPGGNAPTHHEPSEVMTRIFLRPIATPLALGFLALGGATLLLSGLQLGWFSPQQESMYVALALISFGFPLQLCSPRSSASSAATPSPPREWGSSPRAG